MMTRTSRAVLRGGLAAAAIALAMVLTATTAQAHYSYVYHKSDLPSVSSDHLRASVCDQTNNGHSAYGYIVLRNGNAFLFSDKYGSGCTTKSYASSISRYQLCTDWSLSDCSTWRNA